MSIVDLTFCRVCYRLFDHAHPIDIELSVCNNCQGKVIMGYRRKHRRRLDMVWGQKEIHKVDIEIPTKIKEDVYHAENVEDLPPDWCLCPSCGRMWSGIKRIVFLKKICYGCKGKIKGSTKHHKELFKMIKKFK